MRVPIAFVLTALLGAACGGGENAGIEEARRQAEAEAKAKPKDRAPAPAQRLATPVPGQQHVPCEQLIDPAAFQAALNEKQPMTVKDLTKSDGNAAAACGLVRGGKRPSEAEQRALLKRAPRLGILPGDVVCSVTAYCWTIEDAERYRASCKQRKDQDDETMGSYACVHVELVGPDDVKVFEFFDPDTKCLLRVRGGPSTVDNETILACAKTARDTIGPEQIKVAAPAK